MKWVGHVACMEHFGEKGRWEYVKVELLTVMTIKSMLKATQHVPEYICDHHPWNTFDIDYSHC
jgi:hypothetical protein